MSKKDTFLIEIGTEELPPRMLKSLSSALASGLEQQLVKEQFNFGQINAFATPRRLAVLISEVAAIQPDKVIERKGPTLNVAVDQNNCPTPAGLGFARSCGIEFSALEIQKSEESAWLVHRFQQKGQSFVELAPAMLSNVLKQLPMGKTMRWNELEIEFLRPVHWVVLMYGDQVIPAEILGLSTSRNTFGHRFHHPDAIVLEHADQYESRLEEMGKVIPDFAKRQALIVQQIQQIGAEQNAHVIFPESLVDEVTGLVEWPVPIMATYAEDFLTLPKEVLICAIEHHQKCFPVADKKGVLKPCFITVSNIESTDPEQIIIGNERVMRARLSDAAFFFYTDKKHSLESRLETLKHVTFQEKLGTLFDKAQRLSRLTACIVKSWQSDSRLTARIVKNWPSDRNLIDEAARAGLLAKTDLVSDMVHEFPELQGVMGYYYAQHDGETDDVAVAISEQYLPRSAGDELPVGLVSFALGIADRIDTIVGIFSLGQIPSGDKDPFALRRAAIGILRMMIERELPLSLDQLIIEAIKGYGDSIKVAISEPIKSFIIERLRAWYSEKGIAPDTFNAVLASQDDEPLDIHHRILAVERFRQLAESPALTLANKRISNILQQADFSSIESSAEPNPNLFETDAEKKLYQQIKQLKEADEKAKRDYTIRLTEFANLHTTVDHFFDDVMVMVEDDNQRNNRLQLLAQLRCLFLQIADISLLQQ